MVCHHLFHFESAKEHILHRNYRAGINDCNAYEEHRVWDIPVITDKPGRNCNRKQRKCIGALPRSLLQEEKHYFLLYIHLTWDFSASLDCLSRLQYEEAFFFLNFLIGALLDQYFQVFCCNSKTFSQKVHLYMIKMFY